MSTPYNRKPALAAWIQRERRNHGWKPKDVVDRLAAMNLDVTEATVKVWESNAGRRPSPYNIEGLEAIFGSHAPTEAGGVATPPPADLSELREALMSQAESMARMLQFAIRRDQSVEARIRAMEAELQSLRGRLGVEGSPTQSTPPQTGGSVD